MSRCDAAARLSPWSVLPFCPSWACTAFAFVFPYLTQLSCPLPPGPRGGDSRAHQALPTPLDQGAAPAPSQGAFTDPARGTRARAWRPKAARGRGGGGGAHHVRKRCGSYRPRRAGLCGGRDPGISLAPRVFFVQVENVRRLGGLLWTFLGREIVRDGIDVAARSHRGGVAGASFWALDAAGFRRFWGRLPRHEHAGHILFFFARLRMERVWCWSA